MKRKTTRRVSTTGKRPKQTNSTVTSPTPAGARRRRARKKTKKKMNVKRYFQILAIALVAVIAVGAICLGFGWGTGSDSALTPVSREDGRINVLLLGVDVEGLRTDAIMVVSYNIKENNIDILSIPRDTRMYIGNRYQKINAAHAVGGMSGKIAGAEGTIEAVTRLTGIPINYYVEFSFDAIDNLFKDNTLGSVKFNVPDAEGNGRGMNYDDPAQNLHIHLKPGEQEISGNQVQQLLRYRKSSGSSQYNFGYDGSDTGRVSTQQAFIKEILKQKINLSLIPKIPSIFSQMSKDIKTNLTVSDVTKYAKYLKDFAEALSKLEETGGDVSSLVSFNELPGHYNGTDYGASYWICDLEATKTLVQDTFGYDASNITIDSPDGKSVSKNKKSSKSSATTKPKKSSDDDDDDKSTPKPKASTKPKATAKPDAEDDDKATTKPKASSKPSATAKPSHDDDEPTATVKPTSKPSEDNSSQVTNLDEE